MSVKKIRPGNMEWNFVNSRENQRKICVRFGMIPPTKQEETCDYNTTCALEKQQQAKTHDSNSNVNKSQVRRCSVGFHDP